MQEWKILIVDKEQTVLDLLRTILEKEGYKVISVSSGEKAAPVIKSLMPHLIISEVDLPGIDGYELCRQIKMDAKTSGIPFVFLTDEREMEKKIKGLKLGAIDYLTKPFQREELLARVHNILQSCGPPTEAVRKDSRTDKLGLTPGKEIRPVIHSRWRYGFAYPRVAKRIGSKAEGEEIEFLEALATKGLLERTFVDLIMLCPFCGHHDINFRNVCPRCRSANVQWKSGTPATEKPLQERTDNNGSDEATIAVEERLPRYQCGACGHSFERPLNYGRCLQCGKEFEKEKAKVKEIYTYKPTEKKSTRRAPPQSAPLIQALQKAELETYDMEFFKKQLNLEIKRSQRFGEKTSILAVEFQNVDEAVKEFGQAAAVKSLQNMLLIVKKCLRELDLIAVKNDNWLFVLLPETPLSIAKLLANRLRSYIHRLGYRIKLNLSLAGCPENGEDGDKLMETATKGLNYINTHQSDEVFTTA